MTLLRYRIQSKITSLQFALRIFIAFMLVIATTTPQGAIAAVNSADLPQLNYAAPSFERRDALNDPKNRIDSEFKVPARLKERTAFWFDVYTRYGSNEHVIHHVLYPWIVFKVVDTTEIMNSDLPKWTKFARAEKYVKTQMRVVRTALAHLSRKKRLDDLKSLTLLERSLLDKLSVLPGSIRNNLRTAAGNVRDQLGQKDFFVSGLIYSASYLPIMEQEFADAGLPTELTRLPFVESSFNVKAESKVGASGIWQVMPTTGRHFLMVNDVIDERNSPLKATLVAIELFKQNYRQFRNWSLAITAYNHGGSGVAMATRRVHSDDIANVIDKYHAHSFKFASSNFFTCFLAALHAQKYHKEIFPHLLLENSDGLKYHVVSVERPVKISTVMKQLSISREDILIYNLDLRNTLRANLPLPKGYKLILPMSAKDEVIQAFRAKHRLVREASLRLRAKSAG